MLRLVQIKNGNRRRVAVVEEPRLRMVEDFDSIYALALEAIRADGSISTLVNRQLGDESLDYDEIYNGNSDWHLMVPLDHPEEPARTLVSGTGLTHFGSARDRQAMHAKAAADDEQNLTDSMKMFRWGVEGGRPKPGTIGVSPEWFYKGTGTILRAHREPLDVPIFAEDGGEEAELAGLYVIGPDGRPYRIGMAAGNEFSDHQFEKRNYLNLAGSKMRTCSLGPEMAIDPAFDSIAGEAQIERGGVAIWSKAIRTGKAEMCHSLGNIEHHHFKFQAHVHPGDMHIHFYGAHSLSFGDGIRMLEGDVMAIRFDGFGRALRNPIRIDRGTGTPIVATPLT